MFSLLRNPGLRVLPAVAVLCGFSGCRDAGDQARESVLETGRAFTIEEFVRAAAAGQGVVVERFLAAGMRADAAGADGATALRRAAEGAHPHVVKLLLEAGASPDRADHEGVTPLMAAAGSGDGNCVRALQKAGAEPARRDARGRTALDLAAAGGQAAMTGLLSEGLDAAELERVLEVACGAGHTGVIDSLLRVRSRQGHEPAAREWIPLLAAACSQGRTDAVRLLTGRLPATRESAVVCREAARHVQSGQREGADGERVAAAVELLEEAGRHFAAREPDWQPGPGTPAGGLPPEAAGSAVASLEGAAASGPAGEAASIPVAAREAGGTADPPGNSGAVAFSAGEPPDGGTGGLEAGEEPESREIPVRLRGERFPKLNCEAMADVPRILRMTAWEPRAWPVVLQDVAPGHESAVIALTGETTRTVTLRVGDEIPGTGCVIEKLRRRRLYADAQKTKLNNVSELHFRRTATGETFKALADEPVLSNDSTAVLRMSGSGKTWTVSPGDDFRLGSLLLRTVDVTETGLLLENRLTRETVTVPRQPARKG